MNHPIQPLQRDSHEVWRFKRNGIVCRLLEIAGQHGYDLNSIAAEEFDLEDRRQFAQLIGYSLGGYSELPYVDDESYEAAETMAIDGIAEEQARIKYLEGVLDELRRDLRGPVSKLYQIHPDDLRRGEG